MKVNAYINKQSIIIFVDNRSTHNFIYSRITKKVWIEVENHKPIEIKIAQNTRIQSERSYFKFKFET